jgi:hypothetical protein
MLEAQVTSVKLFDPMYPPQYLGPMNGLYLHCVDAVVSERPVLQSSVLSLGLGSSTGGTLSKIGHKHSMSCLHSTHDLLLRDVDGPGLTTIADQSPWLLHENPEYRQWLSRAMAAAT